MVGAAMWLVPALECLMGDCCSGSIGDMGEKSNLKVLAYVVDVFLKVHWILLGNVLGLHEVVLGC